MIPAEQGYYPYSSEKTYPLWQEAAIRDECEAGHIHAHPASRPAQQHKRACPSADVRQSRRAGR